jgi:hypothetical protein
MTRRIALATAVVLATPLAPVAACGGSSSHGTAPDGGSDASIDVHAHLPEAAAGDGWVGPGLPQGATAPQGTQLVASQTVYIEGVTSDGYVVYKDYALGALDAIPVAGGAPQRIAGDAGEVGSNAVLVTGATAFLYDALGALTGIGTVSTWTSTGGVHTLTTQAFAAGPGGGGMDISSDGAHVLLLDDGAVDDAGAGAADVVVIDTNGANRKVLVHGVDVSDSQCAVSLHFVGSYAVVAYCPSATGTGDADAGPTSTATIEAFSGPGWATATTISTTAFSSFAGDAAGTQLLYVSTAGLEVASLATGASTKIDATGTGGTFTSDGSRVVYATSAGDVAVASTGATPAPKTLIVGGFGGVLALSPDNNWLLAYKTQATDPNTGGPLADLYLASTTPATEPPGVATTLSSAASAGLFGVPFTADSSHVLFAENVIVGSGTNLSDGTRSFTVAPTSGGVPVAKGAVNWLYVPTTTSKVLFNANYTTEAQGQGGSADLLYFDTAAAASPKLIATQADAFFYVTAAKDKVVYSWSYLPDSLAGIWVYPL